MLLLIGANRLNFHVHFHFYPILTCFVKEVNLKD